MKGIVDAFASSCPFPMQLCCHRSSRNSCLLLQVRKNTRAAISLLIDQRFLSASKYYQYRSWYIQLLLLSITARRTS